MPVYSTARRWLALLSVCLTLSQCAQLSNTVSVTGRNFEDEVQQTQNLIFSFNKNIGPETPDNRTSAWESTPYITFKPAVKGQFRWTSPSELVFSPATAFDPATDYRADLSTELLKHSPDKDLSVSGKEIAFHTPYLQLIDTETWWTRANATTGTLGQPIAKTRLRFNYPVSAAEVAPKLGIKADEKPVTAGPIQAEDNETLGAGTAGLVVTLTDAPAFDTEKPLLLTIDKGITVPKTAYTSKEAIEQSGTLPSKLKLEVVDVQSGFANQQGTVRVVTTQTLQPAADLGQYYTIQPAVKTTAELTENGLLIKGDFTETDTYVITLTGAVRGVLNTKLDEPVSRDVFFGKMPAGLQFSTKNALYLSSKGSRNVGLKVTNVENVQVKIARLYENNLLNYLKNNRYEDYKEQGEGEQRTYVPAGTYSYGTDSEGDLSSLVVDKIVKTSDLPNVRGVSALNLAIPDQVGGDRERPLRGAYLISVQSKDEAYVAATQLVSISDIGLIARQTETDVLVWANSIQTAEPIGGVEVTLVSSNNQSVYTLKTDAKGFARFDKITEKAPGFKVVMLTARTTGSPDRDDFNFLYLPDTQVETSRFEVDGKRNNATGLSAFVYGDRNIYRPGETIHLNTLVRSEATVKAVTTNIPLMVRVLMPNGSEYRTFRKVTDAQGAIQTDIPVDPAAVTGSYTVEVLNAANVLLTSQPLSIEEFIPDRIKVDVKTNQDTYKAGETITLSAQAQNLFGPPAADRAYEMELRLNRRVFAPKGYADYTFSIPAEATGLPVTFERVIRQGRTNAAGQATEAFPIPASYRNIGLLEAKLFVTVFDENGRPVNRLRSLDVQTQDVFYGVRLADTYLTTQTPLAIQVVGLNKAGKPQNDQAQIDIIRYDYQTVTEKQGNGQIKYSSKRREKTVYSNSLKLGNKPTDVRYVPTVSGEYEVRVRRANSVGYTAASFYAYGWGSTSASSFEVSTEGQVLMEFDKATYETGDKVKVLFKAPFEGKLLVTTERSGVLEHTWLQTNNKAAEWSFAVDDTHLPNVYVTATLIRAMDGTDLPLTVAHGFAPVSVVNPDTKLPVAITAVTKSYSKTKQTIRVKTNPNSSVTIAVVDEGILQVKNSKTPDPHAYFFQKRALEVTAADGYALLYPELSLRRRSSSGGDGYDLERRVNPLSNKRVELVALWSGVLKTNGSGEADYTIDIPQFSGTLRVMAVAYKDNAFGSAEQGMTVSDPIVISPGIPRFLSPGDEFTMPLTLSNTTTKAMAAATRVTISGPLQLVADSSSAKNASLTVQPGRESQTSFRIRATEGIGPGSIVVTATAMGKTYVEKTAITVRPATPLQKTTVSGVVVGGRTQAITLAGNFVPGTTRTSLTISRSPAVQHAKTLSYLLGYPYGCTEQTISKAFPQLYFADLTQTVRKGLASFVSKGESDMNPVTNVQQALQQIENRQLYSGGVSLWPGFSVEDPWASAYALHFMVEAQKAGFEVSAMVKSKLIDRLTTLTGTNRTETASTYAEDGSRTDRAVASRTTLYGLYVLTLAEKPNRAVMSLYKESASSHLTTDGRYLLATAYARLGDQASSNSLMPRAFDPGTLERETGGSYASPIRNMALVLSNLVDTDPDNLQIPTLARQLNGAVQQANYLNTQEAAFAFMALGKLARQNAGSTATATLTQAAQKLGTFIGDDVTLRRLPTATPLTLSTKGTGSVYYFGQSEGVPTNGAIPDEDHGLAVRRTYLSRNGAIQARFKQNDLVVVKLSISSPTGLPVSNIVLTDLLPAGFEVENPRLSGATGQNGATEQRSLDWVKNVSAVDYFDVRDDRVNYFLSLGQAETKTVYYLVRAVSRGRFVVGPASADAMYNPEYRSYHGAGRVVVE